MTTKKSFSARLPQLRKKPTGNPLWVKGHNHPGPGRPKGSQDRYTREIKQALLDAVEFVGDQIATAEEVERAKQGLESNPDAPRGIEAYLTFLAQEHPTVMAGMLSRVMPQQVETTHDAPHTYHTFEEVAARLRALGLEPRRIYQTYPMLVHDEKKTKPD
jgi:hypothetical protein